MTTATAYVITRPGRARPPWPDDLPCSFKMPEVTPWAGPTETMHINPCPAWPIESPTCIVTLDGTPETPWLRICGPRWVMSIIPVLGLAQYQGEDCTVYEAYVDGEYSDFKAWAGDCLWVGSVEDFRALYDKESGLSRDWPKEARQYTVADLAAATPVKPPVATGKPRPRLRLGIAVDDHLEAHPGTYIDPLTAIPDKPIEEPLKEDINGFGELEPGIG